MTTSPVRLAVDLGQVDARRPRQGEREEVGAADHADLVRAVLGGLLAGDRQRLGEVLADHRALRLVLGLAREHDVEAAGQRAERGGRLSQVLRPMITGLPSGQRAEAAQVGRQPPGQARRPCR